MDTAILPPPYRLALAYAPRAAHNATLGLFALDHRLSGIVRGAREPMLAQLKLAWWRDRLLSPPHAWPSGEPLLAALTGWGEHAAGLVGLVDGWEAVLLDEQQRDLADGRAQACVTLARLLGCPASHEAASEAGRRWTAAEFGEAVLAPPLALPKDLRALAVLVRFFEGGEQSNLRRFLGTMRTGLFG